MMLIYNYIKTELASKGHKLLILSFLAPTPKGETLKISNL